MSSTASKWAAAFGLVGVFLQVVGLIWLGFGLRGIVLRKDATIDLDKDVAARVALDAQAAVVGLFQQLPPILRTQRGFVVTVLGTALLLVAAIFQCVATF